MTAPIFFELYVRCSVFLKMRSSVCGIDGLCTPLCVWTVVAAWVPEQGMLSSPALNRVVIP